jgi:GDPmannose 4,6-dehydratase
MKTAFITGITGQDGAYLAKLLLDKGYKVIGGVRRTASQDFYRLHYLGIYDKVTLVTFDLVDLNNIVRTLREYPVDEFYNLAAHSFVGSSWDNPIYVSDINGMGVARILDTLHTYKPDTKFYQASTSEMFGKVQETPQRETTNFYPRSPYGVSKAYAHYLTTNYRESYGMHTSCGILFNHESPLRGFEFVTRKITNTLAKIAYGQDTVLYLGNMNSKRDWGYAADYVEGMWRMLQHPTGDNYVLASGKTTSVRDFVRASAESLNIELEWFGEDLEEVAIDKLTGKIVVRVDPKFFRPAEVDLLLGDYSKAKNILGWSPTMTITDLATLMSREDYNRITVL